MTLVCSANGGNPPPQLLWSNQAGGINSSYDYDFTNQVFLIFFFNFKFFLFRLQETFIHLQQRILITMLFMNAILQIEKILFR